jgi:hypothetical protein
VVCSILMWNASCNTAGIHKEGKLVIMCVRTGKLLKPTFEKPDLDFVTKELFACERRLLHVNLFASNTPGI